MKARLLGVLYALGGIALALGLTFGAYAIARDSFERPRSRPVQLRNELAPRPSPTPTRGPDVSGPCDEAEHADDPRCAPGGEDRPGNDDDNSGRDDDDNSGRGRDDDDDSGSGSDDSDSDDESGSGSDDDSSGSGSDDSDGDSSGSGSDGDD